MVQELSFQNYQDRLPPQNIDAEEAILGGILLDPEAIGRVVEILRPEAFYMSLHQEVYRAAIMLQSQGRPTDLMSVTSWLHDQGLLEKVGGQARLAELVDRTISAVNIDQYAQLVMDKYLRRKLIQVGTEVAQLGYETNTPLEKVLDQSEQKIFNITQSRPQQSLVATSDILTTTFSDIESRSLGLVLPGISCGFYDLDAMTQGFQRSDLIIAAGRPSMGKCLAYDAEIVLRDGSVATIQEIYQQRQAELLTLGADWQLGWTTPSAFVDDGIKPVFRVTTRLGRSIETTLTHPYLTMQGWQKLSELQPGDKIAVPRQIPGFGTATLPEHQVKLLGYLIGDGCLTHTCPSFTNTNPQIQADFIAAVMQFGHLKVRLETFQEQRAPSFYISTDFTALALNRQQFGQNLAQILITRNLSQRQLAKHLQVSPSLVCQWQRGVCSPSQVAFEALCRILDVMADDLIAGGYPSLDVQNSLTQWLKTLHLWGKDTHTKTVPDLVFQLNPSQLALFLNRLFATDGWASVLASGQAQLGFASVSERLTRQVQHLLLRFGIIAALKRRSVKYQETVRTAWQLDITDALSIRHFIETIGIFGKEAAVAAVQAVIEAKRYQTNRDLIPVSVWSNLALAKGARSWKSVALQAGIADASNLHVGKRAPTRSRLLALATALADPNLQSLVTSDIYWDEIISIELTGYKQVYDLTIPGTHNFVANDICVHNTSFVLNIARNIAAFHKLPIAVFSLEMSKEQLVYRLLSSEAQVESGRLRSGRVSQNEWEPLGHAISVLSQLPIFIDDTPNIAVSEMRSKCRRLQAEQSGALGLIMIDYLQLMEGSGSDNRVQELSKVTRALKGLARELQVPIIALSQLSRGVESRTNKRPMMSDLRESGCLTGETLITLADSGAQVPIQDLIGRSGFRVWALNQATLKLEPAEVSHAFSTGIKPVFALKSQLGRTIRATANHKFLTIHGWKRLDELEKGERIALPRCLASSTSPTISNAELALLGHLIGDGCTLPRHVIQYTTKEENLANVVTLLVSEIFGETIKPRIQKERDVNARLSVTPQLDKGRNQYHVTVTGKSDLERFIAQIGAVGIAKQQALQEIETHLLATVANTNRDIVGHPVWRLYAVPAMQKAGLTGRQMQAQMGNAYCGTTLYKQNLSRERAERLAMIVNSDELLRLSQSDVYWDSVDSITSDGEAAVYDLTVPDLHNFVANNIVVHNSIEQDADLIMMLYRDEYYNPDTPDRGISEVILTKHRNGPVGTVKLLFEPQFTLFRNMAAPSR
jgi:replicative DNA helicase